MLQNHCISAVQLLWCAPELLQSLHAPLHSDGQPHFVGRDAWLGAHGSLQISFYFLSRFYALCWAARTHADLALKKMSLFTN